MFMTAVQFTYTYGTRLRYMSVLVNLTLGRNNLGYPHAKPIRNAWEDYITEQVRDLKPTYFYC